MTTSNSKQKHEAKTLGEVLKQERLRSGLTIVQLSEQAGIAVGQIHKLENDKVQKPNPAHLAALAASLGVPLFRLYSAAGYRTPDEVSALEPELTARLAELPPPALAQISRFLDELLRDRQATWEGPLVVPVEAESSDDSDE